MENFDIGWFRFKTGHQLWINWSTVMNSHLEYKLFFVKMPVRRLAQVTIVAC